MTMDLREMNDVKIQLTNRSIMDQYINRYISLMLAQNFRSYCMYVSWRLLRNIATVQLKLATLANSAGASRRGARYKDEAAACSC